MGDVDYPSDLLLSIELIFVQAKKEENNSATSLLSIVFYLSHMSGLNYPLFAQDNLHICVFIRNWIEPRANFTILNFLSHPAHKVDF